MDQITFSQKDEYDDLIEKIRQEHETYEQLQQQIEREHNKIILNHLTRHQITQNVFHANVKVFENVFEVYHLYQSNISYNVVKKLAKCDNCKFYLVEIYINNNLLNKIVEFNCILNISVSHDNSTFCNSVKLKNKSPILEILPISETITECTVSVYLLTPLLNNSAMKIAQINVDFSYHFSKFRNKNLTDFSKFAAMYNTVKVPNEFMEYEFKTNIKHTEFIKAIIKNCYHKLNVEMFSELVNDTNAVFTMNFYTGNNKNTITFDRQTKTIKLKSTITDLVKLKRYLLTETSNIIQNAEAIANSLRVSGKSNQSYE